MCFVRARCAAAEEKRSYRAYVTDALYAQANQQRPVERWVSLIEPRAVDNRTGDEIAVQVIRDAGLHLE